MKRILLSVLLIIAGCENENSLSNNNPNNTTPIVKTNNSTLPTDNNTTAIPMKTCGGSSIECDPCQLEEPVCEDFNWICKKDESLELPESCLLPCENDPEFESIGEACGCAGTFACIEGAVSCLDTIDKNLCGGCEVLTDSPGEACGDCGTNICDGLNALSCIDPGVNICGGCLPIMEDIGDSCGDSEENLWVCDESLDALKCTKTEGELCSFQSDCFAENCSFGVCSPVGYTHVPAGTFTMGAPIGEKGAHPTRENGQHDVTLTRNLFVKQTTVTQQEYETITGANPSYFINCGPDCPVERINFYEMLEYANRLSVSEGLDACYNLVNCTNDKYNEGCPPTSREGLLCSANTFVCDDDAISPALDCNGYRLPTESEWEYFGRAGTTSAFITPSGLLDHFARSPLIPEMDTIGWYFGNATVNYVGGINCLMPDARISCLDLPEDKSIGTHPVAQKAPNMWGLYDITGNIWERVWDISGNYPDPGTTVIDPTGPTIAQADDSRVRRMRGGPFDAHGQYLRIAYRTGPGARTRIYNSGFRLVRSVQIE